MKKDRHEHRLEERNKLIYGWISMQTENLLDAGCAHGFATRFFAKKSKNTHGFDIDKQDIAVASKRYPYITFKSGKLQKTGYNKEYFDTIILADVFEHIPHNEQTEVLNELYRILQPNGNLIITVPHKGLFSFLDTHNYKYMLAKYAPELFTILAKKRNIDIPKDIKLLEHRHYSLKDLKRQMDDSSFKGKYIIKKCFKSGLIFGQIRDNIFQLLSLAFKIKKSSFILPVAYLAKKEYFVSFGSASFNIAILLEKKR